MSTRSQRVANKSQNEKHAKILKACLQKPDNKFCADCKRKDPRWASWNLGIFMCIRCSGIHRSMGTHISRVKSVDLDTWTAEQVESVVRWGNTKANKYWEAYLSPNSTPPESNIDHWIRSKYELKRWAMKGPLPDPSSLGSEEEADMQPESVTIEDRSETTKNTNSKFGNTASDDLDIFLAPPPSSGSSIFRSSSSVQLHGADLFSIGKPAATSAPPSPRHKPVSAPPSRSATSSPSLSNQKPSSHDTLKSSILSLYNTPPGTSPNCAQANTGHARLAQPSVSSVTQMPQGGQFFGSFNTVPVEAAQPQAQDVFGDLVDFN